MSAAMNPARRKAAQREVERLCRRLSRVWNEAPYVPIALNRPRERETVWLALRDLRAASDRLRAFAALLETGWWVRPRGQRRER